MSISGGTIVAPIDGADPYNLLGVPKQPSGYDVGYIGSHERINEFSLVKPVIDSNPFYYPVKKSGFQVITKTAKTSFILRYVRPSNGNWKRLQDFDGYNHNTLPPILSPNVITLTAETPINMGGIDKAYINLQRANKLMKMIYNEQFGTHNINQFIFYGTTTIITDIDYTSTSDTIPNVGVITIDKSLMLLRNPSIEIVNSYIGKFRSKNAGTASNAGAEYEFENVKFTLDLKFKLVGKLLHPYITYLEDFEGGCILNVQKEFSIIGSINNTGTNLFEDSNIEMIWYEMLYKAINVYIVFKTPITTTLANDIKLNLYAPTSTYSKYKIILYRAHQDKVESSKIIVDNVISTGVSSFAAAKCDVRYEAAYNGVLDVWTTPELKAYIKGKPLMNIIVPTADADVPYKDKPILIARLYNDVR